MRKFRSLDEKIWASDILIAYVAIRGNGTTYCYVDLEYTATADPIYVVELYNKLRCRGLQLKLATIYNFYPFT
ncbi:MAG: nucleoside phosphorylase [Crenarchaeota archaeon]|nr:nucleoside phosphorylase [Thermoproteota archaeon]